MITTIWRIAVIAGVVALSACQGPTNEVADKYGLWDTYGGSSDSSHYSSLQQINRDNVAQLQPVWKFASGPANHRSTPIVVDDVMYLVANGGVTAINAATAEQLWFAPESASVSVRGLVYWQSETRNDRRILVIKDHDLLALDADSGNIVSTFGDNGRVDLREGLGRDPQSIARVTTMTPGRVFEDMIIMGSAVGDDTYGGAPGDIRAYDIRSGKIAWTFHTIPHPGEFGYDTWPPDVWQTIGAANAWTAMSLDEQRGIIYVPTGAPSYHFYGGNRVGDNLFSNSLVALNARTGERIWHFQAIHHDVWDYDIAMAPKLLTVQRDGQDIDAVALAGKHGYLFVFDRVTGEPVFPIEERAVPQSDVPGEQTSPTQPYPVTIPAFANTTLSADNLSPYADPREVQALAKRIREARNEGLFTPPSLKGSVSAPGSRGGAQFGNGAVIPDAGLFYLAVIESPTIPVLETRPITSADDFISMSGGQIYAANCAQCHGVRGQGQPPVYPAIHGINERLSHKEFRAIVKLGQGRMDAFPNIPDTQVSPLMDYVDQLSVSADVVLDVEAAALSPSPLTSTPHPDSIRYRSGYHHFFSDTGLLGPPPWSKLMAYDLNVGKVLWQKPYGDVIQLADKSITGTGSLFPTNSLSATAGGLLFSATNDRKLRAWNQATGDVLWAVDLPADPGGIPITYAVDGRQYIVVAAIRGDVEAYGRKGEHTYIAYALPQQDN